MDEQAIFAAALQQDKEKRSEFVQQACGADESLRQRVEKLLAAHEAAGSFLSEPAAAPPTVSYAPVVEQPGSVIGNYQLLQQIGEGGFAVVFMAQQLTPVQRLVAVKIIKAGMDTAQVIARFESERQALALMDHPNIARVFDAGAAASGRPYFVMELVKGVPITEFCDKNHLSAEERLKLFIDVCNAIQHAHQKGIIHRDIKPSNIMVTLHDGVAVVKVIDFGVAKATAQKLTERTLFTAYGQMVGTPAYMSPEQAEMSGLDIDTRTDIYSLGVLLYELLTGVTPFDKKRLHQAAYDEVRRIIREEDPPRPSTRLSTLGESAIIVAGNRRIDLKRFTRLLASDLDWIVMKALEKDRNRRYGTPSGFAEDIQRYLQREPILARSPTVVYRFRRFLQRNRAAVATAGVVVASLALGLAIAVWQAVRAFDAERRATASAYAERLAKDAIATERDAAVTAKVETAESLLREEMHRRKAEDALKRERFKAYVHSIALAHREWLANDIGRARQLLQECPHDLRHWEWQYVHRLCHGEVAAFRDHTSEARAVVFSSDGKRAASATQTEVAVWEPDTGRETFRVSMRGLSGVAFTRDGGRLAVASAQQVAIHNAVDGTTQSTISVYPKPAPGKPAKYRVTAIAPSPDGRELAVASGGSYFRGNPGEVRIFDLETGKELRKLGDLRHSASAIAYSPDGKHLAVSTWGETGEGPWPGEVHIWTTADGKLQRTIQTYDQDDVQQGLDNFLVTDLAFAPDSRRLAWAVSDGTIRVWDLATAKETHILRGHTGWVQSVAFSPQGDRLVSSGADRLVRVWDTATGREVNALRGHTRPVNAAAFHPDGRRVASAGGNDKRAGEVLIWDALADQQAYAFLSPLTTPGVNSVTFSRDGKLFACASITQVEIRETATGRLRPTRESICPSGSSPPGAIVHFSPDGTTIAGTGGGGVRLWNAQTGEMLRHFPDLEETKPAHFITRTSDVAYHPHGNRIATIGSGWLTVRRTTSDEILHKIATPGDFVAFSPDGKRIATGGGSRWYFPQTESSRREEKPTTAVRIWDAETGKELRALLGGGHGLAFSPDGTQLASGSANGGVTVWDAASGSILLSFEGHTGIIFCLSFSHDGKRLATASYDHTIKIWDLQFGHEVLTLRGHSAPVVSVAFGPDGEHLATASAVKPSQVRLWTAARPRQSVLASFPPAAPPIVAPHTAQPHAEILPADAAPAKSAPPTPQSTALPPRLPGAAVDRPKPGPVISAANVKQLRPIAELDKDVSRIVLGPERGELTLLTWNNPVEFVDEYSLRPTRKTDDRFRPNNLTVSPDRSLVAWTVNNSNRVVVFDFAGGTTRTIDTESDWYMNFSPDGKQLATGGYGTRAKVWDVATGRPIHRLDTGYRGSMQPAFSPDGKTLAVGNINSDTRLFDVASGKLLHVLPKRMTRELRFHPDGKQLAVFYNDGTVALWNVATGELQHERDTGGKQLLALDWSPKGDLLVTAGHAGKIIFWEPQTMTRITEVTLHASVIALRFSSDGTRLICSGGTLVVGAKDRKLAIWGIPEDQR